jgi:hypothetical protein
MNGDEMGSDRRAFMKGATAAGLLGAAAINPPSGEGQSAQSPVEDPQAPPGLGKTAIPDLRFPLCYEAPVTEGVRVLVQHFKALSQRDMKAVAETLHFPFGTYEGTELVVVNTPEELMAHAPASLNMTLHPERFTDHDSYMKPGCYDVFNGIETLTCLSVNGAFALCYDRYGSDGKKLLRCEGIYSVTNNDGRWAIQLASTIFPPADMVGVVYEDTIQAAKRLRINHTLATQVADEDVDKLTPQYGRSASVTGGGSWTVATEGPEKVMAGLRVKGVKSRLAIRETTPSTPMRGEGTSSARGDYATYRETMAKIGLGPWGFIYGTYPGGRIVHHTVDKAHVMASAVRYTAAGEEMSLAVQVFVATFRKGRWGMDGQLAYSTPHDRANDIHPGGLSPV